MPPSSADLRLALHVQHHPARAHLLDALLPLIGPHEVITDPEPDGRPAPIRCYLECLRGMPDDCTHLLVLQDDTEPAPGFRAKAEAAISERPHDLVALFLAGAPHRSATLARLAWRHGQRWILMHSGDWTPTVALVWPRDLVPRFLEFCAERPALIRVGDDNVVGEFVRANGLPVWATVPSLVEHPNEEPSLIGKPQGRGKALRVAAVPPAVL